jgi:regulator of cell morphogenesis and NO signaling
MTQISAQDLERRTVGEVVAEDYGRAAVFERYGIDFCCGGDRSVRDACEEAGVVYDELVHALAETGPGQAGESDVRSWPLDELADHIVAVHHHYVRESLPPLVAFSEKVARVHGSGHEELLEIQGLVGELAAELNRHMQAEENLLFPRTTTNWPAL